MPRTSTRRRLLSGRSWIPWVLALWIAAGLSESTGSAADNSLVLTVTASASGNAAAGDGYVDECGYAFTARLVLQPDPKTGVYGVSEERYTLNATGGGTAGPAGSWTYLADQPGPDTVGLVVDFQEGTATVSVSPLDVLVKASTEEGNSAALARGMLGTAQQMWGRSSDAGVMRFAPHATSISAGGQGAGEWVLPPVGQGHFSIEYSLSRGDEPVEAVIIPPSDYNTWLPEGSDDETVPGPRPFTFTLALRIPGTQTSPEGRLARWRCELVDTSREPGLCLNVPPKGEAATAYDLWFIPSGGRKVGNEMQLLEITNLVAKVSAAINVFDYGASARLRVTAILDDHRELTAHVEGDAKQTTLAIPKDENQNHVADAWEQAQGVWGRNLPENWDDDDQPAGQAGNGDGISLYEDYRGFFFGRRHERLAPGFKHLFVYDRDGYVLEALKSGPQGIHFTRASNGGRLRLVSHRTWTGSGAFADQRRIVNFNHGRGHRVDQHALEVQIVTEWNPFDPEDWRQKRIEWGYNAPREEVGEGAGGMSFSDVTSPLPFKSSPANNWVIQVYPAHLHQRIIETVEYNSLGLPQFHGHENWSEEDEADHARDLRLEATRYVEAHRDQYRDCWWKSVSRVVVHEMGHGVGIPDLLKPNLFGPMECVLRYLSDDEFARDPTDRFLLRRREPWPYLYCNSADGSPTGKPCRQQIKFTDER